MATLRLVFHTTYTDPSDPGYSDDVNGTVRIVRDTGYEDVGEVQYDMTGVTSGIPIMFRSRGFLERLLYSNLPEDVYEPKLPDHVFERWYTYDSESESWSPVIQGLTSFTPQGSGTTTVHLYARFLSPRIYKYSSQANAWSPFISPSLEELAYRQEFYDMADTDPVQKIDPKVREKINGFPKYNASVGKWELSSGIYKYDEQDGEWKAVPALSTPSTIPLNF